MKKKTKCPPPPPWMTSWSDLTTLLLTFFILLYNTNDMEGSDFYLVLSSFQGSLGMMAGGNTLSKGPLVEMGMNLMKLPSMEQGKSMAKMVKRALEMFKPEILSKNVRVTEDERGLVITLSGDAFFDPGSATLKEEIFPVLKKAGEIMNGVPNFVRIEGHTDKSVITPAGALNRYETDWELSSARSVKVLRYLSENENVNPQKLSAVAFAQYRPIDDNNTMEGRAFNRRVEIVILRDKGIEPSKNEGIERPLPDEEWR